MPKIFYELPIPEVVMDVIPPHPTLPHSIPPLTKQTVKTVKSLKIQKCVFGQNRSTWKKVRNLANTTEVVQGHKNRALKKQEKAYFQKTYQRPNLLHIPVL